MHLANCNNKLFCNLLLFDHSKYNGCLQITNYMIQSRIYTILAWSFRISILHRNHLIKYHLKYIYKKQHNCWMATLRSASLRNALKKSLYCFKPKIKWGTAIHKSNKTLNKENILYLYIRIILKFCIIYIYIYISNNLLAYIEQLFGTEKWYVQFLKHFLC